MGNEDIFVSKMQKADQEIPISFLGDYSLMKSGLMPSSIS